VSDSADINLATLWVPVLPEVSGFAGALEAGIAGGATAEVLDKFLDAWKDMIDTAVEGAEKLGEAVIGIGEQFEELDRTIETFTNAQGAGLKSLEDDATKVFAALDTSTKSLGEDMAVLHQRLDLNDQQLQKLTYHLEEVGDRLGAVNVRDFSAALLQFGVDGSHADDALRELTGDSIQFGDSLPELINSMTTAGPLFDDLGVNFNSAGLALAKISELGDPAQKVMTGLATAVKEFAKENPGGDFKKFVEDTIEAVQYYEAHGQLGEAQGLLGVAFNPRMWPLVQQTLGDIKDAIDGVGSAGNNFQIDPWIDKTKTLHNEWTQFLHSMEADAKPVGEAAMSVLSDGLDEIKDWFDQNQDEILGKVHDFGDAFIQHIPDIQQFVGEGIRLFGEFFEFMKDGLGYTIGAFGEITEAFGMLTGNDKDTKLGGDLMDDADKLNKLDLTKFSDTVADAIENAKIDPGKLQQIFDDAWKQAVGGPDNGPHVGVTPDPKTPDGGTFSDPHDLFPGSKDPLHVSVIPDVQPPDIHTTPGFHTVPDGPFAGLPEFDTGIPDWGLPPGAGAPSKSGVPYAPGIITPPGDWGSGTPTIGGVPFPGLDQGSSYSSSTGGGGGVEPGSYSVTSGAGVAQSEEFAADQSGREYVYGGATPQQGFDCSGYVSAVWGVMTGKGPGRYFNTESDFAALGFKHGSKPGAFNIGVHHGGGGMNSHMAATFPDGTKIESGGSDNITKFGGSAAGAEGSEFEDHWYYDVGDVSGMPDAGSLGVQLAGYGGGSGGSAASGGGSGGPMVEDVDKRSGGSNDPRDGPLGGPSGISGPVTGTPGDAGGYYIPAPGFPNGQVWVNPGEKPSEAMERVKRDASTQKRTDDINATISKLQPEVDDLNTQKSNAAPTDPTWQPGGENQKKLDDATNKLADARASLAGQTEDQTIESQRQSEGTKQKKQSEGSDKGWDQLGSGLLKGAGEELGFGDILGKPPWEWGLWKLGAGLASWGIGTANAWGDMLSGGGGGHSVSVGGGDAGGGDDAGGGGGGGGGGGLGGLLSGLISGVSGGHVQHPSQNNVSTSPAITPSGNSGSPLPAGHVENAGMAGQGGGNDYSTHFHAPVTTQDPKQIQQKITDGQNSRFYSAKPNVYT
jgi:hypothetical protein